MENIAGVGFIIVYYLVIIDVILLLVTMLKYSIKRHLFQDDRKTMWVNVVFIAAVMILLEMMVILLIRGIP